MAACNRFFQAAPMGRREFLRAGSVGLFGLGLPDVVRASTAARTQRAKACILLFMWGGPAQQDTWDPKPNAPAEYRGEFNPISTNVPGLQICEHLPQLARRADKLAVIRSMSHGDVNHTDATHWLLTGHEVPRRGAPLSEDFPSFGSVLAKLGRGRGALPPFISMMPAVPNGAPRFVEQSHGQGAGWLGPLHDPLRIDADASKPDYHVADFALHADVPFGRTQRRRELLAQIDQQRGHLDSLASVEALDSSYDRAFSLLASPQVSAAFDLTKEDDKTRQRYGMNMHGQAVLQARRLVEAGVPLITVFWQNDGITNVSVYWDTHNRNFIDLKTRLCPVTDQAFSALLDDLESRGMLDDTLVIWTGEMGRTPRVGQRVVGGAGAGLDGRDHWGSVFTTVLAGGGIRGGTVYGASDRFAAYPASDPVSPADLAATVYELLGINHQTQLSDRFGRRLTLCDGRPISAIMQ
jgi:uncharacterized protein (DUF1501 family)